jgi:hypothetical protein
MGPVWVERLRLGVLEDHLAPSLGVPSRAGGIAVVVVIVIVPASDRYQRDRQHSDDCKE